MSYSAGGDSRVFLQLSRSQIGTVEDMQETAGDSQSAQEGYCRHFLAITLARCCIYHPGKGPCPTDLRCPWRGEVPVATGFVPSQTVTKDNSTLIKTIGEGEAGSHAVPVWC